MMRIANAQLWVDDHDEALEFYTQKVGMEVRSDVTLPEMGDFRWLTVGPPGQEDVAITLMAIPGEPVMDSGTADQVRTLMAKGFAGTVFLTTDDVRSDYEELKTRGVEFTEEPEERPYGIDAGFRDPAGNSFRLTQVREDLGICEGARARGLSVPWLGVLRRVAVVDRQPVAVGVGEEGLKADSRVDHVALELDAARLELGLGGLEVVDVELDRVAVGLELDPEGVRLHHGDREVAGLELTGRHVSPPLAERKTERLAVELRGALVVLRRHGDEVDAVQH